MKTKITIYVTGGSPESLGTTLTMAEQKDLGALSVTYKGLGTVPSNFARLQALP
jgi:hypothetical protein